MLPHVEIKAIVRNGATVFVLAVAALWATFCAHGEPVPVKDAQIRSESVGAATLQGYVRDSQQHPVAGVIVSLKATDGQTLSTRTDSAGAYRFAAVRQGVYTLRAEMVGYRDASIGEFVLGSKESRTIDLTFDSAKSSETQNSSKQPEFFDEPHFTVAGVTDTTSLGGHGSSDTIMRNRDTLARDTAGLRKQPSSHDQPNHDQPDASAEQNHLLADVDEKAGKPLEAVQEYQRAAELNPSESNIFDWGTELLLHRAAEPAIEVFTRGNRLFPHSVRMLTALGAAWYSEGSYDQAAQRLCEASDLNPSDLEPYLFMGKMQAVESAPSEAVTQRLERFVKLQPENALANYYYAVSLWKQWRSTENVAQLARVKALLEKAIHLDPTLGLAYLQLGVLYSEQKHLANAISAYRQAIEAAPQLEQAHYRLAQAYRQAGETSKAQAELRLYEQISKEKTEETEREHHEMQQFVYQLKDQTPVVPPQ
jgi:tetratricopeptide (TPR) repeat protein